MVTFVVIINTIISLILFGAANKIWLMKKKLTIVADCFVAIEISTGKLLNKTPHTICLGKDRISNLRYKHQLLQLRIQQFQQIISLIFLGRQMWRRYLQFSSPTRSIDRRER